MKVGTNYSKINSSYKKNIKSDSYSSNNSQVEYILEGDVIRVYVTDKNGKSKCIRTIPLSQATPEILAKVKNITFIDILRILDMQKKDKNNLNKK